MRPANIPELRNNKISRETEIKTNERLPVRDVWPQENNRVTEQQRENGNNNDSLKQLQRNKIEIFVGEDPTESFGARGWCDARTRPNAK